tara:strand:+ start:167 stop:532 length:366 start_codon:yes stop_codon:yes gene_type:complete
MIVCITKQELSRLHYLKKIKKHLKLLIFVYLFCFGCSSSEEVFQIYFDRDYKILDRGGNNVTVISKACSIFPEKAFYEAKRYADFHLRSIIGNENYSKKFEKIKNYNYGQKTCVEILATGF